MILWLTSGCLLYSRKENFNKYNFKSKWFDQNVLTHLVSTVNILRLKASYILSSQYIPIDNFDKII